MRIEFLIAACSGVLLLQWVATRSGSKGPAIDDPVLPLIKVLRKGSQGAKVSAMHALQNLTLSTQSQEVFGKEGGVSLLIKGLRKGNPDTLENSLSVLANLAVNELNQKLICEQGGIQQLILLLQKGSHRAQEEAARAIRNIAQNRQNQDVIRTQQGILPLLKLFHGGSQATQAHVGEALVHLVQKDENKFEIKKQGAVQFLIDVLRNGRPEAVINALELLAMLALDDDATQIAVREGGGIQHVIRILNRSTTEAQGKIAAAVVLRNVGPNSRNRDVISKSGGIPVLLELLRTGGALAKEHATFALWPLAMATENQHEIRNLGGMPLLRKVQLQGTPKTQKVAELVTKLVMSSAPPPAPVPEAEIGKPLGKSGRCKSGVMTPLSEAEFIEELADPCTPILLDVFAKWCGPCKMMTPHLEAVARTLGQRARVVKIDSDESGAIVQKLRVAQLPTFLAFNKQGVEVARQIGMTSEENLVAMIELVEDEDPPADTGST
eukprot:gnl/MRDRNA2_/MRDRNA2_133852_c0_seq1.p1 gnl/MRDRNA2_/MRDRNA2_133852_c0~~gnl/MRDRNA2_/MRDRNA2_133852_c0_seq1.p1  ORF type:complete len:495 (+),score=86.05 gnl/MRDRNA2_/MRDRNA2_133852_c0_seq1:87-1571(+)